MKRERPAWHQVHDDYGKDILPNWCWKIVFKGRAAPGVEITKSEEHFLHPYPCVYEIYKEGEFYAHNRDMALLRARIAYEDLEDERMVPRRFWDQEPVEMKNGYFLDHHIPHLDSHTQRIRIVYTKI